MLSQLQSAFYGWLGAVLGLVLFFWLGFKLIVRPEKYIDSRGYVVLAKLNELEHRYIAKQLLKRDLDQNEVVHHINGKKTDNQIENLCLMNREKHEHFHAWLMWKNKKSGRYPAVRDQKRILERDYDGFLLENVSTSNSSQVSRFQQPEDQETAKSRQRLVETLNLKIESVKTDKENNEVESRVLTQKQLFAELRTLRKQIAEERNIPVYMVFDNRTLTELSEEMPESESDMLEIWGVGPVKVQMYGERFLNTIKRVKKDL